MTESCDAPSRVSVCEFAASSDDSGFVRRETDAAPKMNISSSTIGPPAPKLNEFCMYFCPKVADDSSTNSSSGSRSAYVNTPCTLFVPPRVVDATWPPVNCPRLTS